MAPELLCSRCAKESGRKKEGKNKIEKKKIIIFICFIKLNLDFITIVVTLGICGYRVKNSIMIKQKIFLLLEIIL